MLITPELSTQFVNNCFSLCSELLPPFAKDDSRSLARPIAGQRAWYQKHQRWVNVHAQLPLFSYISWIDTEVRAPTQADVWSGESLEDLLYISQPRHERRIVATQDLCAPGGECDVQEWPHVQETFELTHAYQSAAGKTSWADSHAAAIGY